MERKSLDELFALTRAQRLEAEAIDQESRKILARHRLNQRRRTDLVNACVEGALHNGEHPMRGDTMKAMLDVFANVRLHPEQYPTRKR